MTKARLVVVGGVLAVAVSGGISVVVFGQTARPSATAPAVDELLTEIRGLRADLAQAMSASIRAQLLVGRLQLQEQRMNTLGAQLAEVRRSLANEEAERATHADRLKQMQESLAAGSLPAELAKDVEGMARELKQELSRANPKLETLRSQEADLSGQLVSEQSRWIDFNNRLDEIERSLPRTAAAPVR